MVKRIYSILNTLTQIVNKIYKCKALDSISVEIIHNRWENVWKMPEIQDMK